jgi:hypothetical protein
MQSAKEHTDIVAEYLRKETEAARVCTLPTALQPNRDDPQALQARPVAAHSGQHCRPQREPVSMTALLRSGLPCHM